MENQTYATDKRSRIVLFEDGDIGRDERTNLGRMLDPTKVKVADTAVFDPEYIKFYTQVRSELIAAREQEVSETSKNDLFPGYSLHNVQYKDRTITIAIPRADLAASAD